MAPTVLTAAFEDAAPFLIGFGMFVLVPIVWMMAQHQRRMAEIIHRDKGANEGEVLARLDQMQRELSDLRQRQNEMILAIEDSKIHQRIQE